MVTSGIPVFCRKTASVLAVAGVLILTAPGSARPGPPPAQLEMVLDPGSGKASSLAFDLEPGTETLNVPAGDWDPESEIHIFARGQSKAAEDVGPGTPGPGPHSPSLTLGLGVRTDSLNWTIAASDYSPNILSELDWDDVHSVQATGELRWWHVSNFYLKANFGLALAYTGDGRDSDYLGDDRTYEFSRSYAKADNSSMFDVRAGAGYRFSFDLPWENSRLYVTPLAGLARHTQGMIRQDRVQEVSDYGYTMPLGPYGSNYSSYDAEWSGPFAGLDLELNLGKNVFTATVEYHRPEYKGEANWNLRTDLAHPVSFQDDTDGEGIALSAGFSRQLSRNWSWTMNLAFCRFTSEAGWQTKYWSSGTTGGVPFNGATWKSASLTLGLTYDF